MKVRDLINALVPYGPDTEVLIAKDPEWNGIYTIQDVSGFDTNTQSEDENEPNAVVITRSDDEIDEGGDDDAA